MKVKMQVVPSCPTLCDAMDYTVHGFLQVRILEWVAFPFFRGSSQTRDWPQVSRITGGFFTSWATREAQSFHNHMRIICMLSGFSRVWLCNPGPPGSSVHGILQARILEWVAMPSSRGIFPTQGLNPRLLHLIHWQTGSLPLAPPEKPHI